MRLLVTGGRTGYLGRHVVARAADAGHDVVAVYTREPAAAGRGMELKPSPVHKMADRFGLPVLTPKTLRTDEASEIFRSHDADVAVVVAVSTPHRAESFDACEFIIDTLKQVVTIWKKEEYEDGTVWVAAHP